MKVLIIDDSDLIRQRLSRFINSLGTSISVSEASTVEEGTKLLEILRPGLLVLDISLPDGSGINILEFIKSNGLNPKVVVFTNYPFEQIEKRCRELGALHFFYKATDYDRITETIREIINSAGNNSENLVMKRVLVTDDSPTMRRMIISSLRDLSPLQYEQASSGLDAIEKLALFRFDLVILDLNMPDMHGMEVLRFIRSHRIYKDIPVVILTTRSDEQTRQEALQTGATRFETKPFVPSAFAENIRSVLNIIKE